MNVSEANNINLHERADGRGGVRTWRELTIAGPLRVAGDRR